MFSGMINICQSPFISEANSSLIHQDGYSVENLFSLDYKTRQTGFKIERFVRPPLTLDLCFKLPIDVYYIVLWIELQENNERCKVDFNTTTSNDVSPVHIQKFCGSFSVNVPLNVYYNPLRVSHLYPVNLPNMVEGSQVLERLVCQQINLQALKPISDLTTTTNVAICLKQYTSPKALHIKCLEVWGRPSKLCTPDHLAVFEKAKEVCLAKQQQHKHSSPLTIFNSGDEQPHCKSPKTGVDHHDATASKASHHVHKIPKEELTPDKLLDQLTFELMVLPYRLPSGHYVDNVTVEKCKENDLLYGRQPCDPFTGVPYTETSQPTFCPRTKSEIDKYISSHDSCGSSSCGRTVGTAGQIVFHHYHDLSNNGRKRKLSEKMKIPENNYQKPSTDKKSASIERDHSDDQEGDTLLTKRKKSNEHEMTLSNSLEEALNHLYPT